MCKSKVIFLLSTLYIFLGISNLLPAIAQLIVCHDCYSVLQLMLLLQIQSSHKDVASVVLIHWVIVEEEGERDKTTGERASDKEWWQFGSNRMVRIVQNLKMTHGFGFLSLLQHFKFYVLLKHILLTFLYTSFAMTVIPPCSSAKVAKMLPPSSSLTWSLYGRKERGTKPQDRATDIEWRSAT